MSKSVKVMKENSTGRNIRFKDMETGKNMSLSDFVKAIKKDQYQDYHIRKINGVKTPISNPDSKKSNNLG